jgi:hypothetical protein
MPDNLDAGRSRLKDHQAQIWSRNQTYTRPSHGVPIEGFVMSGREQMPDSIRCQIRHWKWDVASLSKPQVGSAKRDHPSSSRIA